MISAAGVFTFTAPWALMGFLVIPAIWWLVRVYPPVPSKITFPAIRFLVGLGGDEASPSTAPWWLLLLRCFIGVFIVLSVAGPIVNNSARLDGTGPLLLIIDDTWAAAESWELRKQKMVELIDTAGREERSIFLAFTAPILSATGDLEFNISQGLSPTEALQDLELAVPKPWKADRTQLVEALGEPEMRAVIGENAAVNWISDGLYIGSPGSLKDFANDLRRFGSLTIYSEDPSDRAPLLLKPLLVGDDLIVRVLRPDVTGTREIWVRASAEEGQLLGRVLLAFNPGERVGTGVLALPEEIRKEIFCLEIEGRASAGSIVLLDERWKRRSVGIFSGGDFESRQPLLSDLYFVERALNPYNEVHSGDFDVLMEGDLSVLVLTDTGRLPEPRRSEVESWVEGGGILIRFAGPRLAAAENVLAPVTLRGGAGARSMGGAMSWEQPMGLGSLSENSPFAQLEISDDIAVKRQVLAEPSSEVIDRTWARLADGTPLVTGVQRGLGWIVLFHVTANTEWSNLPLSGLFVDMLQGVVKLGKGTNATGIPVMLSPLKLVDGFGSVRDTDLGIAPLPVAADGGVTSIPGPSHPPGLYGGSSYRHALNLGDYFEEYRPIDPLSGKSRETLLGGSGQTKLRHWLLTVAMLLFLIDTLYAWRLRSFPGLLRRQGGGIAFGFLISFSVLLFPTPSISQVLDLTPIQSEVTYVQSDEFIVESTRDVRLAYVLTDDPEIDVVSRAGLIGLSWTLRQRTAIEPSLPVGIRLDDSSILLYPLVYWPVTGKELLLTNKALENLDNYLKVGGMVLLDTRDHGNGAVAVGAASGVSLFSQLLKSLNPPALVPIPDGHALRQAFYLISSFPGRWEGDDVWVESYEGDVNDGVSSLIIGGHDWARAWALSPSGNPLFPLVPGGEPQREMAFRFGVNLVMYALTGNYKADQVHIPSILGRLQRDGTGR